RSKYESVNLWDYETERFVHSGLQFCRMKMGDHSKCGIHRMFNTGTVVGVSANIFGAGFPRNYIPNCTWGGAQGTQVYLPKKAFETAKIVMARRNVEFTSQEEAILTHVFNETKEWKK